MVDAAPDLASRPVAEEERTVGSVAGAAFLAVEGGGIAPCGIDSREKSWLFPFGAVGSLIYPKCCTYTVA